MSDAKTSPPDDFVDSLLSDFLDESGQLLERLNENLLVLDHWAGNHDEPGQDPLDKNLLNDMFRSAHSLKGLSAMLGLSDINALTHKVENVFDAVRNDQLNVDGHAVELMFQAVDRLEGLIHRLREPESPEVDCEETLTGIAALLQSAGAEREVGNQSEAEAFFAAGAAAGAAVESTQPSIGRAAEPQVTTETKCLPAAGVPSAPAPQVAQQWDNQLADGEVSAKYLGMFIDETESSLDALSEVLLSPAATERSAVDTLLITAHRIKGSAATVGLNRAAKLAHGMEDLLQDLRDTGGCLSSAAIDVILRCADALRSYLQLLRSGETQGGDFATVYAELQTARMNRPVVTASFATVLKAACGAVGFAGSVAFVPGFPLAGLKARLIYEKLMQIGDIFFCQPASDHLDDCDGLELMTFGVATEQTADRVEQLCQIGGVAQVELQPLRSETPFAEASTAVPVQQTQDQPKLAEVAKASTQPRAAEPASAPKRPTVAAEAPVARAAESAKPAENSKPAETLRVEIERLDDLMNLAGQLVINQARFAQIGATFKHLTVNKQAPHRLANINNWLGRVADGKTDPNRSAHHELDSLRAQARRMQAELEEIKREVEQFGRVRGKVNDLFEAVHQLGRVSDGIQKGVMETRMVPIGPLFGRFKRVIRDITRMNNKDIQLVVRGEKTELDKRMIDELGDPLIHMVRNSADHGIESPDAREAAGKPRQGTITLDAFHRGNSIYIQVIDDGKGLDAELIKRKAISKGIIAEADAERLTPHQAYQLIWQPGFSTAEQITEISGRGMGMDIVRSKIEQISGAVELSSVPGQGTTLTIKLPLTLAILPSLLAEIDGDVFAVPVEAVREIASIPKKNLATVMGADTACLRGRVVSLVRLANLFEWQTPSSRKHQIISEKPVEDLTLVIIQSDGREVGLVVDRLLGEQDVVIKSLAENYRNLQGVAGASILGDGRVSLILDTTAMIEMARAAAGGATQDIRELQAQQ